MRDAEKEMHDLLQPTRTTNTIIQAGEFFRNAEFQTPRPSKNLQN